MKVAIDAGHGGKDSGAMFRGVMEKDITLNIALELQRLSQYANSLEVFMTRTSDQTVFLSDRTNAIRRWGADLVLSIHCNADPDSDLAGMPEARGEEVYYNPGSIKGKHLAECVGWGLQQEFPAEPWRGIKERGLWMVRLGAPSGTDPATLPPSVLAEVAFIDNSASNNELRNPAVRNRIAFALLQGILRYQGGC